MKSLVAIRCAAIFTGFLLLSVSSVDPARAAVNPIAVFIPAPNPDPNAKVVPPPTGRISSPCGVAVDSSGRFYVSDYYHRTVDVFSPTVNVLKPWDAYVMQLPEVVPLNGPCGLALDGSEHLYVNVFHNKVMRFASTPPFGQGVALPLPDEETVRRLATGVAVDLTTNRVYVNYRKYIAVFDASGNEVEIGGIPLRIGDGTLEDAYGVAVSEFPATFGWVYVPDAETNTVKVFSPAVSLDTPVEVLLAPSGGPFSSLEDAAVAVDRVTGEVYVTDNRDPLFTEEKQAVVYAFSAANQYIGRLKYEVTDPMPVGLAVDNSFTATQGRVYVTSGYTENGAVYIYAPGSASSEAPLAATATLGVSAEGTGDGVVRTLDGQLACDDNCTDRGAAGRTTVLRAEASPSSAFVGWNGGGCDDASETCAVTMANDQSVAAEFAGASSTAPPSASGSAPGAGVIGEVAGAAAPSAAAESTVRQGGSHPRRAARCRAGKRCKRARHRNHRRFEQKRHRQS